MLSRMITVRRAKDRGHANHGWLDSHHTFSFAGYFDEKQMGFRALRVINEDRVAPVQGFGTHSHSNMEIISYVLDGAIEHRDSMGTGSVIRPGDVQRMSAGTGVAHSEFNASRDQPVHFLQIWIVPKENGIKPSYEQKTFGDKLKAGRLVLVASENGRDDSISIHADAAVYAGTFAKGQKESLPLASNRHAWVHLARGKARVNGTDLEAGDAVALTAESAVDIEGVDAAELIVFDLA